MSLLSGVALKLLVFWSSRKLTSLRGPGASALPHLRHSPSFTHYMPCSDGKTALNLAIARNQADAYNFTIARNKADIVAYLRSIDAPE